MIAIDLFSPGCVDVHPGIIPRSACVWGFSFLMVQNFVKYFFVWKKKKFMFAALNRQIQIMAIKKQFPIYARLYFGTTYFKFVSDRECIYFSMEDFRMSFNHEISVVGQLIYFQRLVIMEEPVIEKKDFDNALTEFLQKQNSLLINNI